MFHLIRLQKLFGRFIFTVAVAVFQVGFTGLMCFSFMRAAVLLFHSLKEFGNSPSANRAQ